MNLLNNQFVHAFFDDMVAVGVQKWALWTLAAALVTYGLWGASVIPFGNVIGLIMTANLAVATAVSAWWKYHGREKYAYTSILDMAKEKGRDTND